MNAPHEGGADDASAPVDLTGIDPVHWAETRERVAILRAWCANGRHPRADAERAATRMGVSVAHFYRLVATWKKHRDARLVSGQTAIRGEQRAPRSVTGAARAVVDDAIARLGTDARYVDVLAAVKAACRSAGIAAPSAGTIHNTLMRARRSKESRARATREDIAVASVAVLLPVEAGGVVIDAPNLFLAVERPGGRILHHRLVVDGGRVAAARDMLAALSAVHDVPVVVARNLSTAISEAMIEKRGKKWPVSAQLAKATVQKRVVKWAVSAQSTLLTNTLGGAIDGLPIRHRPRSRRAPSPWRPLSPTDAAAAVDMAVAAHNAARQG